MLYETLLDEAYKELFIRYFRELIQQEHKDCTEEERNGLDISLNILNSLK